MAKITYATAKVTYETYMYEVGFRSVVALYFISCPRKKPSESPLPQTGAESSLFIAQASKCLRFGPLYALEQNGQLNAFAS